MRDDLILPGELALRPALPDDDEFFQELFRSTRRYLYQIALPESSIDNLVQQQYRLQQTSFAHHSPDACHLVILLSKLPIGKVIIDRTQSSFHIIDLAIVPERRGQGIGTAVLRAIQAAAEKIMYSVELSVDQQNKDAKKLYLSLGFQVTGSSDTHDAMNWTP